MRINKDDIIAGQSIVKIRDFLNSVNHWFWDADYVIDFFKVDYIGGQKIIEELEMHGYIEKYKIICEKQCWINTLKGSSLSLASAGKPISRNTADRKLKEFIERVKEVNSNQYYLYRINKVIVFGSYLSNKEDLGDIDIAIEIVPKEKDSTKRLDLEQKRILESERQGRRFNNYLDKLLWPREEVLKYLKSRSRSISLHPTDDGILKQTEYKIIYESKE